MGIYIYMPPCASNTASYESTAATMTADETQLQGGGPGSTFHHSCSLLGGKRKRRRKTRKASRKKRRQTKRAGSGMFDTVYDSIFGKQEKPPPKPKTSSSSSDEFEVLDVDPSSAPWLAGPADGGYKGQGIGLPMEDVIDPSDYDSEDLRILGLNGDPTEKQIKDAYRKKARKCHPDKVQGKLKEFQKLQGANERVMEKYRMKHPTASKKKRPKKTTKKRKKPKKKTSKKTAKKTAKKTSKKR
jgi:hypothetical protein